MSDLTHKEKELVALGAAMGSNCIVCTRHHITEAKKAGFDNEQIAEAIRIAEKIKRVPAEDVANAARKLIRKK